ncbi:membrane protein P13 [Sphaerochaeta associata]|uniref:P13 family porin n=1 Tax=Sphaerochaeta associata TaxID=1129264 RepID=A0ABY4D888_9SPIR|nr:P13 family porin [Sphaerochaeta associata]UOM49603.1 P13 family porin [Sphaerochaeta associata]SMP49255.1 membrane protein P13 [Sphaerochaeta associata]
MKRFLMCCLVLVFLLVSLGAQSLLVSLVGTGLDALNTQDGILVEIDGEHVYLGGSTLGSLKRTLRNHDFQQLSFDYRLELYEQAKVGITWPAFKNLLVGFGSGSKLQGDLGGQLFGQIADWTAATTIGVGLGTYLIDLFFIQLLGAGSSTFDDPLKDFAVGTMAVGAVLLVAERLIQAVLPIPYGTRYNKTLRSGLGVTKDGGDALAMSLAVVPYLETHQNPSLSLKVFGTLTFPI